MLIKKIPFRNTIIEVYRYGTRLYYYPSFNGNAEFTTYKQVCSYIRGYIFHNNLFRNMFS